MLKQKARLIARVVYLVDLALTSLAFFAAFFIRDLVLPRIAPAQFPTGLFPLAEYLKIYPLVLIMWSVLLFTYHSYHSHRTVPVSREALTIFRVVFVGNVLLATLAYLLPLRQLSRSWFVLFAVLSAIFLVMEKIAVRVIARWVRLKGLNYRTILIVGTGRRAIDVARVIYDHKYWGYKILGFVADGHHLSNGWARYRVYGTVPELRRLLEQGHFPEPVDEIVFAVTRKKLDEMKQMFILCEELGIRARVAMNFFQNRVARIELEELEGIPFLTFTTTPSNETQLAFKRMLDVSVSALLLVLGLPIIVLAALGIKLSSGGGSVIYKQERIGLNGRIFTLYKFRTMLEDADARRDEVNHLNEMTGPVFKAKSDPRVTPIGRLLRKFSLDELPQLWNVLKGDMSLVGPRPPIPEEVRSYHRWHRRRLSMKPGLTCLWQISGRNNIDFDRWMKLDLQYIDNWSPSLDMKILLRTIPAVLSGRGAS